MLPEYQSRRHYSKYFLLIYSFVCTLWLIIRTGRRPNRLAYPCQRAAASQSLWLWTYLLGSSPSFIHRIFSRESALRGIKNIFTEFQQFKRLLLAAILITAVFMFSFGQSDIRLNQTSVGQTPANLLLSTQSSITVKEDSSSIHSVVTITGSDNHSLQQPTGLDQVLTYSQVKDMVWFSLDADTSSESLNHVIQDNDWVVIKPNIVTAPIKSKDGTPVTYYWYQGIPHKGQNTDLRVVKAVIEYLVNHKNLRRISIAEGSAEWAKLGESGTDPNLDMDGWTVHWQEFDNLSYYQIRDEINATYPGLVDILDLSYDNYRYVEVPDPFQSGIGGLQRSGYYMPATVLDCDKWIDIAAMKTHSIPGLSLAMKLRIGTLANQAYGPPEEGYMELHNYGAQGVIQAIIDMQSYRPADYAIIEGIWSTEGDGPQWGDDLKRNVIIAGNNAVAVDAVGAAVMGYNPWDLEYLHLAGLKKLGAFNLQQIEVIGDWINRVAINFKKPIMWPDNKPYIGRGNRNWLLNGTFSGNDLSIDFLGNESSIQPSAGLSSGGNTWQLYMGATDKIDLKKIFGNDADNCIVYACTYAKSSQDISTHLWIGVDDGIKVWVNGQVIFSENHGGSFVFPEHKIPITLIQGTNTILCKILNYSADFEFRMNTSDDDGDTPLEIEYTTKLPNSAPAVPRLLSPSNYEFIDKAMPTLTWTIPSDVNGDSLHFQVEVSADSNFISNLLIFKSFLDITGFSPTPPIVQGHGAMDFVIPRILADRSYWWRVAAWDGNDFGEFSPAFQFTIDTTHPELTDLAWANPGYRQNWYNQKDSSHARLHIVYTEVNLDSLVIDLGVVGNPLFYYNLKSGIEQTLLTDIEIQYAQDANYPVMVQLWDKAGQTTADTIFIKLDSSPPSNSQATAPDTSVFESFIVSWANTGSDGNGVGLSGLYDVKFKIDSGPWQNWLTQFEGSIDTFKTGEHGHTYCFEVASWDYLNNRESLTGVAECSTVVDTTVANIAPQKPIPISPVHRQFINTLSPKPTWLVPADGNGDALHFTLQLSQDSTFSSELQSYSSMTNAEYFSPSPPCQQGIGTVQLVIPEQLSEAAYWWRVAAYDGLTYGSFSDPFSFFIDITPPSILSKEMTNPVCSPNWYNQKLSPQINLKVKYQENHTNHIKFYSTSIPLSVFKEIVPVGGLCEVALQIDLGHSRDGKHLLHTNITDLAENTTVDTFSIQLDSVPPFGATASAPDTSRSGSFTIDWQNTASDSGSGLSGKFDIQMKIDDGQFEIWKTMYHGTSIEFTEGENGCHYSFEVAAWDRTGNREALNGIAESITLIDTLTSEIKSTQFSSEIPHRFYLKQNYPNPFNNISCIEFGLPIMSRVRLTIYDVVGRTIKILVYDEIKSPGIHRLNWDGTDSAGNQVASSLYFYKIELGNFKDIKKLMFIK